MNLRIRKLAISVFILAALLTAWHFWNERRGMALIPGLEGPLADTPVAEPKAPRIEDYGSGGPTRLAVLVTDIDSDWIGMVRALKARGIPTTFTRDVTEATKHHAVIAYPLISGKVLESAEIRTLAAFVRGGGGLMTFDLAGGGLEALFGTSGEVPDRTRTAVQWEREPGVEASKTPLNAAGMETTLGSQAIQLAGARALARYDDGSVAMSCRTAGGQACVLGVDVGSYANRAYNLRAEPLAGAYANVYADGLDRLVEAVRDFYVANEPNAYLIGTAPAPYSGSLILTHDLDAGQALSDSVKLAKDLHARGVAASFFMQTKYIRDWNDDAFFQREAIPQLNELASLGMEVGSHSVSHSRAFNTFEIGDGSEAYPSYHPIVDSQLTAHGGTVMGELRVSKYLLDASVRQQIESFRPGHLRNPPSLPQALAASGYRFTSDLTAANALTNYPYQLAFGRSGPGLVPVWEFPVAIEDEAKPGFAARRDASIALIDRITGRGGVATVLVHPDQSAKRDTELAIIDRFRGKVWIGPMGTLGRWWQARDLSEIDWDGKKLNVEGNVHRITIYFPRQRRSQTVF